MANQMNLSPLPGLACNMNAIGGDERPRYQELVRKLRGSIAGHRELSDGYTFRLEKSTGSLTLVELAQWIQMERLCCPFLTFQIEVAGPETELTLRGPSGTKAILAAFV